MGLKQELISSLKKVVAGAPLIGILAWKAYYLLSYLRSSAPIVPCHYREPYIKSDGGVFPCCRLWNSSMMRIGHIDDEDIFEKIKSFDRYCGCHSARLRRHESADGEAIKLLYTEFSLACQATCAMCCVNAPSWHGSYDYYDSVMRLVEGLSPETFRAQGGEVLIQKQTIEWLRRLKKDRPGMNFELVTNGNVGLELVETVEGIFGCVSISIVGFEPETYRKVMGLELARTIAFAEKLVEGKRIKVILKYLITPINLHESGLFLKWALRVMPDEIFLADANTRMYVKETEDGYWEKIIQRTASEVKGELVRAKGEVGETKVFFEVLSGTLLSIDEEFIKENSLGGFVGL